MYIKQGFLVFEIVIFLFLFSFFSLIIMTTSARCITMLMDSAHKSERIATIISAVDWLIGDIQGITSHQVVVEFQDVLKIQNEHERITWKLDDTRLLRIVQRYDAKKQRWKKPKTSRVADAVCELLFNPFYIQHDYRTVLQGIVCQCKAHIGQHQMCIDQTIALRNGIW